MDFSGITFFQSGYILTIIIILISYYSFKNQREKIGRFFRLNNLVLGITAVLFLGFLGVMIFQIGYLQFKSLFFLFETFSAAILAESGIFLNNTKT